MRHDRCQVEALIAALICVILTYLMVAANVSNGYVVDLVFVGAALLTLVFIAFRPTSDAMLASQSKPASLWLACILFATSALMPLPFSAVVVCRTGGIMALLIAASRSLARSKGDASSR